MYEKPKILDVMLDHMTHFNVEMVKRLAELGIDLIVSGGDYAEEKGPFVPLKFFEERVFPRLKEQVDTAHKYGIPFIKHTDGNVMPLLPGLSKIVDGMHSLDPSAGIDIGIVKEMYGDRLVLIGNVSVDNLANRAKEEIVEETKKCIRRAAPGGGYILSSSNSWYAGCKLENCIAMVEAGWRHGKYP
jgi:uroporphyrinogen decarboxylase